LVHCGGSEINIDPEFSNPETSPDLDYKVNRALTDAEAGRVMSLWVDMMVV